jgi:hypothetical protein
MGRTTSAGKLHRTPEKTSDHSLSARCRKWSHSGFLLGTKRTIRIAIPACLLSRGRGWSTSSASVHLRAMYGDNHGYQWSHGCGGSLPAGFALGRGSFATGPATRAASGHGLSLLRCLEVANRLSPNLQGEALARVKSRASPAAEWPWPGLTGPDVLRLLWC